jgi:uncharacterized protein YjbK
MSLVWITKASYLRDYQIEIEFNNHKKGVVDFKHHLDKKIFEPLKEIDNFRNFKINSWTIEWDNGADFSPEFLLENLN